MGKKAWTGECKWCQEPLSFVDNGKDRKASVARSRGYAYCNAECTAKGAAKLRSVSTPARQAAWQRSRLPPWHGTCHWEPCASPMVLDLLRGFHAHRLGYAYCSKECGRLGRNLAVGRSSAITTKKNAAYYSNRMKVDNPMRDPKAREKSSETLRAMGWKPPVQGGNGRPTPVAQKLLADALGWPMEVVVPTRVSRRTLGLPKHYKLDIADEATRTWIEVDGPSHNSAKVRAADLRKKVFLEACGWTLLRFSNQAVMDGLAECVQMVLSITSRSKALTPT